MLPECRSLDEPARLAAVKRLEVLDTGHEEPFENVVELVRSVLGVPMATVTLIDADRQWFKAQRGLDCRETPREFSICAHAIRQDKPFLVQDTTIDARFAHFDAVTGAPGIRAYAGVPLRTPDGYNVGALCAMDDKAREFTPSEVAMLSNMGRIVMQELQLRRIAEFDQLTGAASRHAFCTRMREEIERFRRYERTSCILLIDADHFKQVNDRYGHGGGDEVLREIVRRVHSALRPNDLLGRLGGEEFAIILPETSLDAALATAERLRLTIAGQPIEMTGSGSAYVTASFGVAEIHKAVSGIDEWIRLADQALYTAKAQGRNRCVAAKHPYGIEAAA